MTDTLTHQERSRCMALVRSTDTKPELLVRRMLWRMGFRYRVHMRDLPGKPDIVFRKRKKAIFVNGCFWHMHEGCARGRLPKSRLEFWVPKLVGNKARDARNLKSLVEAGWSVLVIWECETKNGAALEERLRRFLTDLANDE